MCIELPFSGFFGRVILRLNSEIYKLQHKKAIILKKELKMSLKKTKNNIMLCMDMKISDYIVRSVAGKNYLVYTGPCLERYIKPVVISDVGAMICERLIRGMGINRIVDELHNYYAVDREVLLNDIKDFTDQLIGFDISVSKGADLI